MIYAVIDTNVLVSALLTHNVGVATAKVLDSVAKCDIVDRPFYEVSLSVEDSFLVTGNLKHFPVTPKVVTPSQMIDIINNQASINHHSSPIVIPPPL